MAAEIRASGWLPRRASRLPVLMASITARRAIGNMRKGDGYIAKAYSEVDHLQGVVRGLDYVDAVANSTPWPVHPKVVPIRGRK